MAQAAGVSASTVGPGVAPAPFEATSGGNVQISNDPQFTKKLKAIIGLYLAPPERALVLCVDEKSQISE